MSVASPTATDSSTPRTVDRSYLTLDDRETQTPAGRALHRLEGVAFGGSQQAVYYRADRDRRLMHDQRADLHVAAIASEAQRVLSMPGVPLQIATSMHLILGDCGEYFREDGAEDAAALCGDQRVSRMHRVLQRIAAWAERSRVALRAKGASHV